MDPAEVSDTLTELALDLRWAWNHAADELWHRLDPEVWELTRNAWFVLQTVSKENLQATGSDPLFQQKLTQLIDQKRRSAEAPRWFEQTQSDSRLTAVAYFSLEFMLGDA